MSPEKAIMPVRITLYLLMLLAWAPGCRRTNPVTEIKVTTPGGSAASSPNSNDARAARTEPAAHVGPTIELGDDDWPTWRGPTSNGISRDKEAPLHWSEHEHVLWRADLPGRGHSSPAVVGPYVFIASATDEPPEQLLLCLDRATGQQLWQTRLHAGGFVKVHEKTSQAAPSPACDGRCVYLALANGKSLWVTACTLQGRIAWQTEAGPFVSMHGYGASPALWGDLVIVGGDNDGSNYVAALHRDTGQVVWRIPRPPKVSFSSPIVARLAGREQVILAGCELVTSYDPRTGDALWWCGGLSQSVAATATYADDRVYASGGYPEQTSLCVRADGQGDVTHTHVAWQTKEAFYVPSLVVNDGYVYGVSDKGIACCLSADDGRVVWKRRLGGTFSASPTLVGDTLYAPNEAGALFVWRASPNFEQLAVNDLHDGGFASPVVCGGRIYLRTFHHLYCIGDPPAGAAE